MSAASTTWTRRTNPKDTGDEGAAASRTYTRGDSLYPRLTLAVAFTIYGSAYVTCSIKRSPGGGWSDSAVPASLLADFAEAIAEAVEARA